MSLGIGFLFALCQAFDEQGTEWKIQNSRKKTSQFALEHKVKLPLNVSCTVLPVSDERVVGFKSFQQNC